MIQKTLRRLMMKLHNKLALGLISSLFVVSLATAAAPCAKMSPHYHGMDCDGMGMMSGDMKRDPVTRANSHLTELSAKLNLTADQQPAWKTFSDQVKNQARNMATMRDQMRDNAQSMPNNAPERMAKMADWMKVRAQNMAEMAGAVKTFYAVLSPQQKTDFDKMHTGPMACMN
jgi:Spy/CpxP family protein refolding chaperone